MSSVNGKYLQLPPTVISEHSTHTGVCTMQLQTSLLQRVAEWPKDIAVPLVMLLVCY